MKQEHETFHANRTKSGRPIKPAFSFWDFATSNSERHAARLRQIENAAIEKTYEMIKQT